MTKHTLQELFGLLQLRYQRVKFIISDETVMNNLNFPNTILAWTVNEKIRIVQLQNRLKVFRLFFLRLFRCLVIHSFFLNAKENYCSFDKLAVLLSKRVEIFHMFNTKGFFFYCFEDSGITFCISEINILFCMEDEFTNDTACSTSL